MRHSNQNEIKAPIDAKNYTEARKKVEKLSDTLAAETKRHFSTYDLIR